MLSPLNLIDTDDLARLQILKDTAARLLKGIYVRVRLDGWMIGGKEMVKQGDRINVARI